MATEPRRLLMECFHAALQAVNGRTAVARALRARDLPGEPITVIAMGKAAEAMLQGAFEVLDERIAEALLVTKPGHCATELWRDRPVKIQIAGHPEPDAGSLAAGQAVLETIRRQPSDRQLLILISGGTSSLVEVPAAGVGLEDLQRATRWLLASGLDIGDMNRVRKRLSRIKGGGLLAELGERPWRCLLISDVPDDDPASIGSGPLVAAPAGDLPPLPDWLSTMLVPKPTLARSQGDLELVATLDLAMAAAADQAKLLGLAATIHAGRFDASAESLGTRLASELQAAPPGLHVWGGESIVILPDNPGRGGRNQHLALAAAKQLAGDPNCLLLAAGTDGTDGPTEDAGGLVDGQSRQRGEREGMDIDRQLREADAGRFLEASGDLLQTGATGTNVMDLVLGLKLR